MLFLGGGGGDETLCLLTLPFPCPWRRTVFCHLACHHTIYATTFGREGGGGGCPSRLPCAYHILPAPLPPCQVVVILARYLPALPSMPIACLFFCGSSLTCHPTAFPTLPLPYHPIPYPPHIVDCILLTGLEELLFLIMWEEEKEEPLACMFPVLTLFGGRAGRRETRPIPSPSLCAFACCPLPPMAVPCVLYTVSCLP